MAVETGHCANNGLVSGRTNPVPPPRYGDHRSDPMVDSVAVPSRRGSEESAEAQQLLDSGSGSTSSPSRMSQYMDSNSDSTNESGATPIEPEIYVGERNDAYVLPPHLRMVQQLLDRLSHLSQNHSSRNQHTISSEQSSYASNTPSDGSSVSALAQGHLSGGNRRIATNDNVTFTLSQPSDRPHSFHEVLGIQQSAEVANDAGRSNSTTGIPSYAAATLAQDKPPTYEVATSRTPSPTNNHNPRRIIAAGKTFFRRSLLLEVQPAC